MSAHWQGKKVCTKIYMNFMLIPNRRSWRTSFTIPFRFVYRTAGISALSRSLDSIERDISWSCSTLIVMLFDFRLNYSDYLEINKFLFQFLTSLFQNISIRNFQAPWSSWVFIKPCSHWSTSYIYQIFNQWEYGLVGVELKTSV